MSDKSSVINTAVRDLPSRYPQKAIADLQACCTAFKDLTPRVSKYVYDNGREYRMICLSGTIPMHYRGNTYNIPVNIWIHNEYPEQYLYHGSPGPTKHISFTPLKLVGIHADQPLVRMTNGEELDSFSRFVPEFFFLVPWHPLLGVIH
eukprot:sb/3473740/